MSAEAPTKPDFRVIPIDEKTLLIRPLTRRCLNWLQEYVLVDNIGEVGVPIRAEGRDMVLEQMANYNLTPES